MNQRDPNHDALSRWLRAEAAMDDAGAERALARLFVALPRHAPAAAFAERVLLRAGVVSPAPAPLFQQTPVRWAVAALFLVVASAALFLPTVIHTLLRFDLGRAAEALGLAASGLSAWLVGASRFWTDAAEIGDVLARVVGQPTVALILALGALLTLGLYQPLFNRLAQHRSIGHVDAI